MEQDMHLAILQALKDARMYNFWFSVKIIAILAIAFILVAIVTWMIANYSSQKDMKRFAKEAEERARREKIRNEKV